jgi:hypothetical protein
MHPLTVFFQPHTSYGHDQYPLGLRGRQGDDITERPQRFGYIMKATTAILFPTFGLAFIPSASASHEMKGSQ